MDSQRFDQLTRFLTTSRDRRTGLKGAVTVATAAVLGLAGDVDAKQGRGGISAQGPCGNGSDRANKCKRNRDCCTGFCHKKSKRCRCRKRGQTCKNNRSCCNRSGQNLKCVNGRCQKPGTCTPVGAPCQFLSNECCQNGKRSIHCAATPFDPICQNCNRRPTVDGNVCGDPSGNQCCGGSPFCVATVRAEDPSSAVCTEVGTCDNNCEFDGDCGQNEVCVLVSPDSGCCDPEDGEIRTCVPLCDGLSPQGLGAQSRPGGTASDSWWSQ